MEKFFVSEEKKFGKIDSRRMLKIFGIGVRTPDLVNNILGPLKKKEKKFSIGKCKDTHTFVFLVSLKKICGQHDGCIKPGIVDSTVGS